MILVTSWDYGYTADMKIADLLCRYGFKATFFVPVHNREGRSVLDNFSLRQLDKHFEVGSHTFSHRRLDRLDNISTDEEIYSGKKGIEDILGHTVDGFSYPGGHITLHALNSFRKFKINYARTVENFRIDTDFLPYHVPTTLRIFPHRKPFYIYHLFRNANFIKRLPCFLIALSAKSIWDILFLLADHCSKRNGIFHIWGHSWEIEHLDMWRDFSSFLERVRPLVTSSRTIGEHIIHLKS